MRWQHRTAAFRKSANNGSGNDNNGSTACGDGNADRRKRASPDREHGSGNRADCDRHRANNNDPPKEEIIIPPKPSTDTVAQKVAEYINQFHTEQGDVTATVIPGLTEYCNYRCTQLKTNFAHDTADQRAAAEALQYGEYVDWSLYGIEGEENYYTANVREAIGKGNWGGTADEIAYSIANGFRNSKGHWSYVGSSKYTYMAVGVIYDGYYWYVCVCMDSKNTDLK